MTHVDHGLDPLRRYMLDVPAYRPRIVRVIREDCGDPVTRAHRWRIKVYRWEIYLRIWRMEWDVWAYGENASLREMIAEFRRKLADRYPNAAGL